MYKLTEKLSLKHCIVVDTGSSKLAFQLVIPNEIEHTFEALSINEKREWIKCTQEGIHNQIDSKGMYCF